MDIEGITVLSQKIEEVVTSSAFTWSTISILLFICAGLVFAGLMGWGISLILKNKDGIALLLALLCAIGVAFLIGKGIDAGTTTTTYEVNTYSVTINETVPFREVVDNYNLISRDGEIFVLQEKVPET